MLRKLILSVVLGAGALTGLALTPATAEARPPWTEYRRHDRRDRFEVLYRHRNHWDRYGTYRDRDDAERAARHLRHRGYDVRIQRV
jgi:hypothetical protein